MSKKRVDFSIEDHGTIVLFRPLTQAALDFFDEHIGDDSTWFGGALVVEHRYADNLAQAIVQRHGLQIQLGGV